MYKAPIEIFRVVDDIIQQVEKGTEKAVHQAVIKCGVNVDKEELKKALMYDREQYDKGYVDGVREFVKKIREIFFRYSHLHSYASKARVDEITNHCEGAKIEMQSVWDVLSLGKHDLVNYEEMNRLQDNIEVIAKERLLAELKKDFRVLINEMASETLTKIDHSSLCETETYAGVTDTNVGGKKNDFKE